MHAQDSISTVEQKLADLDGLVTALRYINEGAADDELPALRSCTVSLLYLMGDAIRSSQNLFGRLHANGQ